MKQTASRVVLVHVLNDSSLQQLITAAHSSKCKVPEVSGIFTYSPTCPAHEVETSFNQRSQSYNVGLAKFVITELTISLSLLQYKY